LDSPLIDEDTVSYVTDITQIEADKLTHLMDGAISVAMKIVVHSQTGARHKYSVALKIKENRLSANDDDWDLPRAVHKVFANMRQRLEHLYHGNAKMEKNRGN
jgi:ribosome-associated translation inhibitor RaiA